MEQVLLTGSTRSGTTLFAFSPTPFRKGIDQSTGYVTFNDMGITSGIYQFSGDTIWSRNNSNHFAPLSSVTTNYQTGYTFIQTSEDVISQKSKDRLISKLPGMVEDANSKQNLRYLFKDEPINDIFYNVSITKTFDTLDTFNVYNSVSNSSPILNANTGVVFGKLEAIQKIKNPLPLDADHEDRDNVRIPLRNVPIGIFQESEEFPQTTSVDENGDRIKFSFKTESEFADSRYFNTESQEYDEQFLNTNNYDKIPDHYKLMTTTNENGEFIIYNVPVGTQSIVFEVDLLKQGLTKEEVALNFFPYPTSDSPNIDTVPHFFFRQIPVDVVPAWGDFQTGYTEVNISANIDLRKWATYYFVPSSYGGFTMPELPANNINNPLSIAVRDMTKPSAGGGYNQEDLMPSEIVQIGDTLDRDTEQEISWFNEFIQRKSTAKFRHDDFSVIKLPANIYHPTMINSVESGNAIKEVGDPIVLKTNPVPGTWFASYQFKQFITRENYRTTGAESRGINGSAGLVVWRNHFDLTYPLGQQEYPPNESEIEDPASVASNNETLTDPLYEQPWSYFYPNEVSIPTVPVNIINDNPNDGEAKYSDGDLIGVNTDTSVDETGGYGLQKRIDSTEEFINKFSQRVTKNYVYKYEQGNFWDEKYGTGYANHPDRATNSSVENGEGYQRVECGFAYFMRPMDWPIIKQSDDKDYVDPSDHDTNIFLKEGTQDMSLNLDGTSSQITGRLDIYRILNPSPSNLISPDPIVTPTFINIDLQRIYRPAGESGTRTWLRYPVGNEEVDRNNLHLLGYFRNDDKKFTETTIFITNLGERTVNIRGVETPPNKSFSTILNSSSDLVFSLPGNGEFDFGQFKFTKSNYSIRFEEYSAGNQGGTSWNGDPWYVPSISKDANEEGEVMTYYYVTQISGNYRNGKFKNIGMFGFFKKKSAVEKLQDDYEKLQFTFCSLPQKTHEKKIP